MKVAIVGASGFVGTRLVERFHLAGGPEITAVVRCAASLARPARFLVETHVADPLDTDALARAFSGCSAVVHVARGDPDQTERMPAALCLAANDAGVHRLVYLSCASVHGENPAPGTDERSALLPQTEQGRAKVRAEHKFFAECRRHGLVGFVLRPGIVYGPRSRRIAELAADLLAGRAWLYEGGRGVCNAIYVDNLVTAIACCLHASDDAAGAYLVGDGERITWEQFYRAAALQLDVPWHNVHQLSRLPAFPRSWQDRAVRATAHPFVQRLLPLVPSGVKRGAKAALAAAAASPRGEDWALPGDAPPRITPELALAQQCAWPLPHARAEQHLDYRPDVPFAEAIDRSFAWWRFAQGEISFAA
jgi:nucleoside-diphosphate-sugar epimerase